MINKSDSP